MSKERESRVFERVVTNTQALHAALSGDYQSLKELSGAAGLSEKELPALLDKLQRSLQRSGERLETLPALCQRCGLRFGEDKTKRPSRCPKCKSERLSPPRFRLAGKRT